MKSLHSFERHSGDAAALMVLALLALMAGGDRIYAASHGIPAHDVGAEASLNGTTGSGRQVREIDDPSSGTRWWLVRDKTNPGPGRMELALPETDPGTLERQAEPPVVVQTRPAPIIRAGDKLVVEEHSATADAYLEGVALQPAVSGSALHVRLSIGGRVVRAVAVAPGRAALETPAGGRR